MKKQKYILENCNSFELAHIFECGQCFRWNKQIDGSYTGVIKQGVINVKKQNQKIIFTGMCEDNLKDIVTDYFDLNRDYEKIKMQLSKVDENVNLSIKYGNGIRILNQDLWETIISFIISANNNFGKEIIWNNEKYYTFPTPEELKNVTIQEYRKLGLGFRDVRLYETTHVVLDKKIDLENLQKEKDTILVREELLKLSGVGPKVADCILLFSDSNRCLGKKSYK